jgi:FkbM family methyltransferase
MTTGQTSDKKWYGQNQEDRIVAEYFGDYAGNLLSIGENNGWHLSNCRALIEMGWSGIMVEPSPDAFLSLFTLYYDHPNVWCFNAAISDYTGKAVFYESGEHLGIGDTALLSTLDKNELKRWEGTSNHFEETEVLVWDFKELQNNVRHHSSGKRDKYQFISIDAEGLDLKILHQMDLKELDCRCLCIEHNGNPETFHRIECHAQDFGMKLLAKTPENVIYVK